MMNRPFFRPHTGNAPENIFTLPDIDDLRRRILRVIMMGTSILAFIAIVPSVVERLRQGNITMMLILLGGFIVLLALTFLPRIPYRGRAFGFLFLVALIGMAGLATDGLYGNGRLYLIGLPILASLLLGGQAGIVSMVGSMGVLILAAVLMLSGRIPLPVFGPQDGNASLSFWVMGLTTFGMIATTVTLFLYYLLNGLTESLTQAKRLAATLDTERSQLEHRVMQRTQDLERRLVQIRTAAEISRSITVSFSRDIHSSEAMTASAVQSGGEAQNAETLLQKVVDLVRERFNLYYVGVFLLDERERQAILRAGTGEAGQQMLADHHKLSIDDNSMVGWSIRHRQARIALDVAQASTPIDAAERGKRAIYTITRFDNPALPKTRSEVALPMMSGETALGAMSVQSERAKAFDQDDITVLQGITDTLTSALENARLFQQARQNLSEISSLNRQYFVESWRVASHLPEFNAVEYVNEDHAVNESQEANAAGSGEADLTSETLGESVRTSISIPLKLREQAIGHLALERETPLTPEEQSLVDAITTEAALALENVRLLEQTQRRAGQERMLSEIAHKVRGTTDIDTILSITVRELGQALSASEALIQLDVPEAVGESVKSPPPSVDSPDSQEMAEGQ